MSIYSIEILQQEFKEYGWHLISTTYKNLDTILEAECPNKHRVNVTYRRWRENHKCVTCEATPFSADKSVIPPKSEKRRILALDQASVISGWAVYDDKKLVSYGILKVKKTEETNKRLVLMIEKIKELIREVNPDIVYYEDIQLQNGEKGYPAFKVLAQLQGALIVMLQTENIKYESISSQVWRNKVDVKGRTREQRKANAKYKVEQWYNIAVTEDEADAICIGRSQLPVQEVPFF